MKRVRAERFVHLHAHTEYSFLDALPKVKGLGTEVRRRGFRAYAITDHGNICGVYSFVKEMQAAGVKPIVGCEFYLVPNMAVKESRRSNHVVVLAKNNRGWRKIIRGLELAYEKGFYYKPRIDDSVLFSFIPDVIVLTACLGGVPSSLIRDDKWQAAVDWAWNMTTRFGDDFYIEIQPNEMEEQIAMNRSLVRLAEEVGCDLVSTCDVHYLDQDDWETHDVMLAIRDSIHGKRVLVSDPNRFRYSTKELWLKTRNEMEEAYRRFHPMLSESVVSRSLDATVEIADRIEANVIEERKAILPIVDLEGFESAEEKLVSLVREGWKWRRISQRTKGRTGLVDWIEGEAPQEKPLKTVYAERVKYELDMITGRGFAPYFLVLYDLIWWARRNGIRVGPGRGSVGGSLVAYLLGITSVDSIKYRCPFSRFISPERIDYPDIDTDFPTAERERVKQYLRDKYGSDQVASICTFSKLKGKAVLKDVARAFGVPYAEVDRVSRFIVERAEGDDRSSDCLVDSVQASPELRSFASNYPQVIEHASKLEGNIRQLGVNAAGVVISDAPLRDLVPVQYQRKHAKNTSEVGLYLTGWDKRAVEAVGLLKLDVLGIESLTYIQRTLDLIKQRTGEEIEPEDWTELDDPSVYENFQAGNTELVWQMNTLTTIRLLRRLKPDRFEHLVATTALIRPGPMNAGITDQYVKRRHGEEVKLLHPILEKILGETYGLFVFQEDVIRVCHDLGGFSWAEADRIRKDVGKKKGVEYLRKTYVDRFTEGAKARGVDAGTAHRIWDQIAEFGMYGFNRAHATAYSMLSYWTMYLKIHYPIEFMTAALEAESDKDKRNLYIREARRLGLDVLPPDVNVSGSSFAIDGKAIRFGLEDVKGVGGKTVEKLVSGAPYADLFDFLKRSKANKTVTKNLLSIGALDSIVKRPWDVLANIETIWKVKGRKNPREALRGVRLVKGKKPSELEVSRLRLSILGLPPEVHPATSAAADLETRFGRYPNALLEQIDEGGFFSRDTALVIACLVDKIKLYTSEVKDDSGEVCRRTTARITISDSTESSFTSCRLAPLRRDGRILHIEGRHFDCSSFSEWSNEPKRDCIDETGSRSGYSIRDLAYERPVQRGGQ